MRWVTFYYNQLSNNVTALEVHKDRETALKHFNSNCKRFFALSTKFKADKLPATYGYPLRMYYGISATAFKKMFDVDVDEAIKLAQGKDDK